MVTWVVSLQEFTIHVVWRFEISNLQKRTTSLERTKQLLLSCPQLVLSLEVPLSFIWKSHCPLSGGPTVLYLEVPLSFIWRSHCPLSGGPTVHYLEVPLSFIWRSHCPLSGGPTVLYLEVPLSFIWRFLCTAYMYICVCIYMYVQCKVHFSCYYICTYILYTYQLYT